MPGESPVAAQSMNGLPAQEALRLLQAVPRRRARRSYTGEPVPERDLAELAAFAKQWQPWPGARCSVIAEAPPALFMGVIGAYGGISASPSALAFIGSGPAEAVGYSGEAIVLEATARGLGTCWVAGVFRPGVVETLVPVSAEERVFAVSALGSAMSSPSTKERILFGAGRAKKRRPLEEIAPGQEAWPGWARAAVAAAQVAPSAMNRQPWRFTLSGQGLLVSCLTPELPRAPKRLDCGIAMLHAELGAFGEGVTGTWRLLESPDVAVFVPDER